MLVMRSRGKAKSMAMLDVGWGRAHSDACWYEASARVVLIAMLVGIE